ncbi:MAG: DUF2157 domain-containing protein [Magnetococcales bacterium]|nr:DUF2157 domain-containing protein [Magnetococcales bacterium]
MSRLSQRIHEWTQEGLISADQAVAIITYEDNRPKTNRLLYSFMALGAGVLGIGIITLIAANWDQIPHGVKLGVDLTSLLAIAYGLWQQQGRKNSLVWELLLLLFALGCLASIGLIGQIYHASGKLDHALLLWAVLTFPVATLAQRPFLPALWTLCLIAVATYRLLEAPWLSVSETSRLLLAGYGLPLTLALLAILLRCLPNTELFAQPLKLYAWIGGIGMIVAVDIASMFRLSWPWLSSTTWIGITLAAMLIVGISFPRQPALPGKPLLRLMIILFVCFPPLVIGLRLSHWYSALFTLAIFALAATWLVQERSLRWANTLVFLLGARFLILFFTAFGGLIDAGIGLILSGFIILAFVWMWSRVQGRLLTWMAGLAS